MGGFWWCCAVPAIGYSRLVCPCVGGLDEYGGLPRHPSISYITGHHVRCLCVDGICLQPWKAAAYHEYVTEPFTPSMHSKSTGPIRLTCPLHPPLPARPENILPSRFEGGTDPSERKTVRSRPGGPRLDWVLCISYLAIISGVQDMGGEKGFTAR